MNFTELRNRSIISYLIIFVLFIINFIFIYSLIQSNHAIAEIINIAGKQRMLSQRVALLSNNYIDSNFDAKIELKLKQALSTLKENHEYIKSIKSKDVDQILYGGLYNLNSQINSYLEMVEHFISSKSEKDLKYINFENESILNISDTLVSVFEHNYVETIENFKKYALIAFLFSILSIRLLLKPITINHRHLPRSSVVYQD